MRHKILLLTTAVFLIGASAFSRPTIAESPADSAHPSPKKIIIKETIKQDNRVTAILSESGERFKLTGASTQDAVMLMVAGDRIDVDLESNNPDVVKELKLLERPVSTVQRALALGAAFLAVFLPALLAAGLKPLDYIIGADHRYSNSKLQMVLWFSALMTVYLATVGLRVMIWGWDFLGGVGLTENLLSLSGFSILTYGAAKAITQQQANNLSNLLTAVSKTGAEETAVTPHMMKDFFRNNDGKLDLGDTQMFFIALLVVILFLLSSFQFLGWIAYAKKITLPDIDTTLLAIFGLGQGAYLIKKAATPLGKG